MRLLTFIFAFSVAVAASIFDDWHPAVAGDARSPCPALNSLANHGILPRDGRNLTIDLLVEKLHIGLNVSPEIATSLANAGIALSPDPKSGTIDLDDLNKHNAIEHDGSLSRRDVDLGGDEKFCKPVFDLSISFYGKTTDVGLKEVAAARWGRLQVSKKINPKFTYGSGQQFGSFFESTAYHQLLRNATTKTAKLDWIKIFFSQERLPYKEGWRPVNLIDGFSISQDILQLALLTPGEMPATSPGKPGGYVPLHF